MYYMALCCGLFLHSLGHAQHDAAFTYRISIEPRIAGTSPKALIGALENSHYATDIGLEDNDRVLRFVAAERITIASLNERSARTGFTVAGLSCIDHSDGSLTEEGEAPMPQHIDTGNEFRDHARYEAAKAAWIERHPEVYQRMIAPRGTPVHE